MGSIRSMVLLVGNVGDNVGGGKMRPSVIRQFFISLARFHNKKKCSCSVCSFYRVHHKIANTNDR